MSELLSNFKLTHPTIAGQVMSAGDGMVRRGEDREGEMKVSCVAS